MALALKDRVKETTIVVGTGTATLLGSSIGFQPFSVVGNGNTTYYCISDQFGSNWEVGIGTYSTSGNTLARTTVLASSNGGALVVFTAGIKDVFVTYPAEKGVWLDASGNAIGLGTPAAFVGTNITGTASGLTAGNVTTNANLTGAVTSSGNATSLGSFTSLQLATALTNETGSGSAVFSDNATLLNPTYTGTLTGSTGVLNIGSGQIYKDASGNVGIGTSSPAQKLEIAGNNYQMRLGQGGVIGVYDIGRNPSTGEFNFYGYQTGTVSYIFGGVNGEFMRINSAGNVGIGTSSPSSRFEVANNSTNAEVRISSGSNVYSSLYLNAWSLDRAQLRAEAGNPGAGSGTGSGILSFWTAGNPTMTERMRLDSSGNLLVGTTSLPIASTKVGISGASASALGLLSYVNTGSSSRKWSSGPDSNGNFVIFNDASAGAYIAYGGTSWTANSDERLKTDLVPIENGLEKVNSLRSVTGRYLTDEEGKSRSFLIAQDVQAVLPEAVSVQDDELGTLGVAYTEIIPLLVASIKELKAIIDTQQEQINSLLGK